LVVLQTNDSGAQMAKKRVAVIGLGIMGHGMALNFLKAGHEVTLWNRTPSRGHSLETKGATLAASPRAAAQRAEVVFEVVSDDAASQSVWLGEDGILSAATPAHVLIAASSLSIDWTLALAALCDKQGLRFLDIPLTGSRWGAEGGTLQLLAGGDDKTLQEIEPTLQSISKKVYHFGPVGSGMRFKLLLNAIQAIHNLAAAEAVVLAEATGLDLAKVAEALMEMGPASPLTGIVLKRILEPSEEVNFAIEWIAKDLRYARQMAEQAGISPPLLADAEYLFTATEEAGAGELDWAEIHRFLDFEIEIEEEEPETK